jgi:hypothetical protein
MGMAVTESQSRSAERTRKEEELGFQLEGKINQKRVKHGPMQEGR